MAKLSEDERAAMLAEAEKIKHEVFLIRLELDHIWRHLLPVYDGVGSPREGRL